MTKKLSNKPPEIDVAKITASLNNRDTFPTQLIACMLDYGFSALGKYLEENNAPEITGDLIQALQVLAGVLEERAKSTPDNGSGDDITGWAVGTVGRGCVELGESFRSPSGILY